MRQGQQNRRGRGRNNIGGGGNNSNNNNRKSQNPLTRSFESAGPDVKLRGTPSHIAEKYITLARDALSSGDRVLAENYLQHAEHYNRIIMTYREQQLSQGASDPFSNGAARTHSLASPDGSDGDEFGDEDSGDDFGAQGNVGGPPPGGQGNFNDGPPPQAPQPRYDNRQPRQDGRDNRGDNRPYNNTRNDRGDRNGYRGDRPDRQDRPERYNRGDRFAEPQGGEPRYGRDESRSPNPNPASQHDGANGNGFRRRERFQGGGNPGNAGPANAGRGDVGPSHANTTGYERGAGVGFPGQGPQPSAPLAVQPVIAAPMPVQAAPIAPAPALEQEQPAFLRRPVRRPRRDDTAAADAPEAPTTVATRRPAVEEKD